MSEQYIGVFDSGIGGLSVLRELVKNFPHENFLYLGDTARLPYGSKSPEIIRRYSVQLIEYLLKKNVKAIIVACNSASTQVPESHFQNIPIYNVIDPGAAKAVATSKTQKIAVLGTRALVNSQAYTKKILNLSPVAEIFSQACPLFVPLAEEGLDLDPITNLIAYRYIQPLLGHGIDTVVLACTHYPLLKGSIERVTGLSIALVDSGEAISEILRNDFVSMKIQPNTQSTAGKIHIQTTDFSDHYQILAQNILYPQVPSAFEMTHL